MTELGTKTGTEKRGWNGRSPGAGRTHRLVVVGWGVRKREAWNIGAWKEEKSPGEGNARGAGGNG